MNLIHKIQKLLAGGFVVYLQIIISYIDSFLQDTYAFQE